MVEILTSLLDEKKKNQFREEERGKRKGLKARARKEREAGAETVGEGAERREVGVRRERKTAISG